MFINKNVKEDNDDNIDAQLANYMGIYYKFEKNYDKLDYYPKKYGKTKYIGNR